MEYLNQPLRVTCVDGRIIYGVLVCVSAPYSLILQNSVCQQHTSQKIALNFHYTPQ
jgi:small nuclear ribonucleoprotein (snRNP)-like protein